jgi:hypothetical protein
MLCALIVTAMALSLNGCSDGSGDPVETSLTLRNSSDYEIEHFGLQYWGSTKIERVNPMEYPLEDDTSLKPGEEREFTFVVGTNELSEAWGVSMSVGRSNGTITFAGVIGYEITFDGFSDDGEPKFLFTAFDEEDASPDVSSEQSAQEPIEDDSDAGSVAMFNGTWWYREEPIDGFSLDIFYLEENTVIYFDRNGNELLSASVQDNGDGTFYVLELDIFGDVECQFVQEDSGEWIIQTTEDGAVFRIGDALDFSALTIEYIGKWYRYGGLEEDYISINEDGSYALYTMYGDEVFTREEGGWVLQDSSDGGKRIDTDGSFITTHYFVTDDGSAMWDTDYHYYLKESLIGSVEGDLACQMVSLYAAEHWEPEEKETGSIYLGFNEDGTLTVYMLEAPDETGSSIISDRGVGSWKHLSENNYSLTLDDGTEHTFTVDKWVLTLDDGAVFNRFAYFS